jgi:peptidyl-tRNA hydrolase
MDEVLLGLIESAGEKGITASQIKKLGKKDVPPEKKLPAYLKQLSADGKIYGPYKVGRSSYYFSQPQVRSEEKINKTLFGLIESAGEKGITASQIKKLGKKNVPPEKKLPAYLKQLSASGKIYGPHKVGRSSYYFSQPQVRSEEKINKTLFGLIESAGEKGITASQIKKLGKKNVPPEKKLAAYLKQLSASGKIYGPHKFGNSFYYFSVTAKPSADKTKILIEHYLQAQGTRLIAKSTLEKEVTGFASKFIGDALRILISEQHIAILKTGKTKKSPQYILHRNALSELFGDNSSASTNPTTTRSHPVETTPALPAWPTIVAAYKEIDAARGGFGSVPIGALIRKLGIDKERFHQLLLEQARHQHADLLPTTSTNLSPEELEGILKLPDSKEPFVNVTLREG